MRERRRPGAFGRGAGLSGEDEVSYGLPTKETTGLSTGRFPSEVAALRERVQRSPPSRNRVGYFAGTGCPLIRFGTTVEARAPAGNFPAEVFASAGRGIFPAVHSSINLLYCDNDLSPPPLFGPEPLSTESA